MVIVAACDQNELDLIDDAACQRIGTAVICEDKKAAPIRSTDSLVANELMIINDTPIGDVANVNQYNPYRADFEMTSEEQREAKIAEILEGYGFEVSFVD